jgi:hypothetical protein
VEAVREVAAQDALAVLLPPVGLLLAVTTRGTSRRAGDLAALAILVGTALTVVLTLVALTTAGNARIDG